MENRLNNPASRIDGFQVMKMGFDCRLLDLAQEFNAPLNTTGQRLRRDLVHTK
jgi:hypothetical protein